MHQSQRDRLMDLCQQSGCFEPGNITDAEAAVDADDVFYSEAKRGRRPGGVRAIWLEGAAYRGRPTRVFAWLGVPAGAQPRSLPGMVLVHGGGGTAFATWVHRWVKRGYAAIAIDTCGNLPRGEVYAKWVRHEQAGPPGSGGFDQVGENLADQWPFHAVAATIKAHSVLRSLPEVDPTRIGLTGISWGGFVTCLTAATDDRFRFAAPVYACGFYDQRVALGANGIVPDRRWLDAWDPANHLKFVRIPTLWTTGSNDFFFPLALWTRSHQLVPAEKTLCVKVRSPHSHVHGWRIREIEAFADTHCRGGRELCPLETPTIAGGRLQMPWPAAPVATICYTEDAEVRINSMWKIRRVRMDGKDCLDAAVPEGARWLFVNRQDDRGHITSSAMVKVK